MHHPTRGCAVYASLLVLLAACGEPECPPGYDKVMKLCKRQDGGLGLLDGAVVEGDEDAATPPSRDGGQEAAMGEDAVAPQPGSDGSASNQESDGGAAADGSLPDAGATPEGGVAPECDQLNRCSAGYSCAGGKCVSACAQTQCDPNATCALVAGAAACTCNAGYVTVTSGATKACVKDRACEELGCDTNASCDQAANGLRQCVCKAGYTGTGMTCAPISCPALQAPSNGTVSRTTGTYGQEATFGCNTGYDIAGLRSRRCEANGQWTAGTETTCTPKRCPTLTDPAHGNVDGDPVYPNEATYSCDSNWTLNGSATRKCQANGQWSGSAPTCLGCGDAVVSTELGEQCEATLPPHNAWTCNAQCRKITAYVPCRGNDFPPGAMFGQGIGCETGQMCLLGGCVPACSGSASQCPVPPRGQPRCETVGPNMVCIVTCSSSADCAPGLVCANGTAGPFCAGCVPPGSEPNSSFLCPTGRTCLIPGPSLPGTCI